MLLGDLIFLEYCIMLCDNCILVLLLLKCILPLCFRSLILAWGIFALHIYVTVTSPYPWDRGVTIKIMALVVTEVVRFGW